jgi:hypothetical protein
MTPCDRLDWLAAQPLPVGSNLLAGATAPPVAPVIPVTMRRRDPG